MELNILLILSGISLIAYGFLAKKHPDFIWVLSRERRRYVEDDAEPTKRFLEYQKISAVSCIILGGLVVFLTCFFMLLSIEKYVVKINSHTLKIPCSYSDIQELGFVIDSDEEIRILDIRDSITYIAVNTDGEKIKITFDNDGRTEKLATDCKVTAIFVSAENGPDIKLPNGVEFGMRESQVEDIMGNAGINENYEESIGFKTYEISVGYNYTNYTNQDNYNHDSGIVLYTSSYSRDEEISWIRVSVERY